MTLGLTPSQTVGPFFAHCLPWPDGPYVVADGTPGGLWLRGRITDEAGDPVPDALVESWQADPDGRFAHPDDPRGTVVTFRGFGRCPTDLDGQWAILTLRPGRVPDHAGVLQAPHIDLSILGRGLLDRLVTRIYLPDEPGNAEDPVLSGVDPARRATLIATPAGDGFRFDVRLRGPGETVFFSV